jgi:hypothetical protein
MDGRTKGIIIRDHFFGSVDPSGAVVPAGASSGRGVPVTAASAAVEDVEGGGVIVENRL